MRVSKIEIPIQIEQLVEEIWGPKQCANFEVNFLRG